MIDESTQRRRPSDDDVMCWHEREETARIQKWLFLKEAENMKKHPSHTLIYLMWCALTPRGRPS